MATHDYAIANADGATVRTDINNCLAAIVSQNSSTSAPGTTFAYMLWADTTNGLLKQRNSTNSGWVTVGTLDATTWGLLSRAGGTVTGDLTHDTAAKVLLDDSVTAAGANLPLCFDGDTNTGAYRPAADTWALVTNGSERYRVDATGRHLFGATSLTPFGGAQATVNADGAGTGSSVAFAFATNANQKLGVYYRSAVEVGSVSVTTTNTTYNTSSDARLKDNRRPLGEVGDLIDAVQVLTWDWNHVAGETGTGFVAQQLAEVIPEAVSRGDDDPDGRPGDPGFNQWGVDASKVVPYLTREIQSLRRRVAALESA